MMRPRRERSGEPGGCGMPRVAAHAMNSELSQKEIVGATVKRYIKSITTKIATATMVFNFSVFTARATSPRTNHSFVSPE